MALESEALLMTYSLHLIGYNKPLTHHSGTANMEKLLRQPTSIFVRRTEIDDGGSLRELLMDLLLVQLLTLPLALL